MTTKQYSKYLIFFFGIALVTSCNKEKEWLDKKSNKQSVVPETIKDFQAMLDNPWIMNSNYSFIGNAGTDNFFVAEEDFGNIEEYLLNAYRWDNEINWPNGLSPDWNLPYTAIAYANLVMEGLQNIDPNEQGYNSLLGQAYFYRAFAYLNLSQIFCKPYNAATAGTDLGLPIRLSSDVSLILQRSNLQDVYDQIIEDAERSLEYLDEIPKYIQRPSKPAANALLARAYLLMDDFGNALSHANEVLDTKNELIDFNDQNQVSHNYAYKFSEYGRGNPEILFYVFSGGTAFSITYLGNPVQINESLFSMYDDHDLRKEYFFERDNNNRINAVSTYVGTGYAFGGLSVNETLLIRAECLARQGRQHEALSDLNTLLVNRYRTGTFIPYGIIDHDELITLILHERRKELPVTGNIRWEDLRRLNKDPKYQVTIKREINGQTLTLPPNDARYVLPIPMQEINYSGIEQNVR